MGPTPSKTPETDESLNTTIASDISTSNHEASFSENGDENPVDNPIVVVTETSIDDGSEGESSSDQSNTREGSSGSGENNQKLGNRSDLGKSQDEPSSIPNSGLDQNQDEPNFDTIEETALVLCKSHDGKDEPSSDIYIRATSGRPMFKELEPFPDPPSEPSSETVSDSGEQNPSEHGSDPKLELRPGSCQENRELISDVNLGADSGKQSSDPNLGAYSGSDEHNLRVQSYVNFVEPSGSGEKILGETSSEPNLGALSNFHKHSRRGSSSDPTLYASSGSIQRQDAQTSDELTLEECVHAPMSEQEKQPSEEEGYMQELEKEFFRREFAKICEDPFKIVVVGNAAVGKTSVIRRYVKRKYTEEYRTTVGVDLEVKDVQFLGVTLKLHIWDIAGEERSRHMTRALFRDLQGVIVVNDATKNVDFSQLLRWKNVVHNSLVEPEDTKIPFSLMLNKVDLVPEWKMLTDVLNKTIRELGYFRSYETSAKKDLNIDVAFLHLIQMMVKNRIAQLKVEEKENQKITLSQETASARKKCAC